MDLFILHLQILFPQDSDTIIICVETMHLGIYVKYSIVQHNTRISHSTPT